MLFPFIGVLILQIILSVVIISWISRSRSRDLKERNKRLTALRKLDQIIMSNTTDLKQVSQQVTDAIAFELGFEVGVLALLDEGKGVLKRVAMSRTQEGNHAKQILPIKYEDLEIPIYERNNLGIKALYTGEMQTTENLYDVFLPIFDKNLSKQVQETVNIRSSIVYPILARRRRIGVMIVSSSKPIAKLSEYDKETIRDLVDVVGIALENAMLYTDLKSTTEQLKDANLRLKQLDKLKDDFVSIASHELRTPMTAIRSYVWMALNRPDVPLTDKMKKYLSRTLISTERLINLVNDMLNVSRIEAGRVEINPKAFDIVDLAKEIVEEVKPKADEKNLKVFILEIKVPQVFADPDKVHQVLLNLVGNALKFTPNGGSVTISFFTDGAVVETWVKDTGQGIANEDLAKLFKKFERLDNSLTVGSVGGTGLGLYISRSLIILMRGKIWASSEGVGKGATFTFSLPVANVENLAHPERYRLKAVGEAKPLEPVTI